MKRINFNEGWTVKKESCQHQQPNPVVNVTLPHDALFESERDPSAWNGTKKGFFNNGAWEYVKQFDAPDDWRDRHIALEFEGVYNQAMVYINGCYVGQRPFGYSEFHIVMDDFLKYGQQNTIKVTLKTADDSRWYSGAGIYRNVNLLESGLTHLPVNTVRVTTEALSVDKATILIETQVQNLTNTSKQLHVKTEIFNLNYELITTDFTPVTVPHGDIETVTQRLCIASPHVWSIDSPVLYLCKTTLLSGGEEIDTENNKFGIRVLTLDTVSGLQINGETIKLRGCCIHHDNGVIGARTFASAEYRRVKILKKAGFNAIRSAHHPASRAMLDACDVLGMLVMDETFDVWSISKSPDDYSLYFPEWWERDTEAMVNKDYNHPSVIMYSIGNEIPDAGTVSGGIWGRKISQKIKSMDKSRFTTIAINGMLYVGEQIQRIMSELMKNAKEKGGDINSLMADADRQRMDFSALLSDIGPITEEVFASVDIAGYNYMLGRYEQDHIAYPNRVIVGSETFTKDIAELWSLVTSNAHVIGDFAWTGWDYLGETGIGKINYSDNNPMRSFYGDYPYITGDCGDIDITSFRLPASYYREIVYGLRSQPYIAVQNLDHYNDKPSPSPWGFTDAVSSWDFAGHEGEPARIEVYSGAEEVELLLNGTSLCRKRNGTDRPFTAIFETVYQPGILEAVTFNGMIETGRYTLNSPGDTVQLCVKPEVTSVKVDGQELIFMDITLVDENGIVHISKDRLITVNLEGAGQLIGFGSGSPMTTENYLDNECTTYKGRALAVILPTEPGVITVTVSDGNGQAACVDITCI